MAIEAASRAATAVARNRGRRGSDGRRSTVVAPAIANAIFNADGMRVRSLPITQAAVRKELQGKKA